MRSMFLAACAVVLLVFSSVGLAADASDFDTITTDSYVLATAFDTVEETTANEPAALPGMQATAFVSAEECLCVNCKCGETKSAIEKLSSRLTAIEAKLAERLNTITSVSAEDAGEPEPALISPGPKVTYQSQPTYTESYSSGSCANGSCSSGYSSPRRGLFGGFFRRR